MNVNRPPTNIPLGRQGENLATCIIFDCTGLAQLYGDGTAELLHELKSGTVYPVAIKQDGTSVSWIVTASDTAIVGSGRAELRWYVGDTLAKSAKFRTSVSPALPDKNISTPPAPYQSWVDKVLKAAQEIKDGAISDEKLAAAIAAYLADHPIDTGLDEAELAAYLAENGYLTDAALADAITRALAEAKASGQFDGAPGKDGANGADGQNGADGVTPNIQIGTVETLEAGSPATASMTGTPENPLLNLGIPKGADSSGGGSGISGFRLVRDMTLTEDAESVIIKSDDEGNPFSLSECYIWIFAKVTEAAKITYIPNGYFVANTYFQSSSTTATDYSYDFIAYSVGSEKMFWGYEIKTRGAAAQGKYNVGRSPNASAYFRHITSYRIDAKFAAGARFLLYGRDA